MASSIPSSSQNPNLQHKNYEIPPFLTREQFLLRRARHSKALYKLYKDHYWALAEEIRAKHRDYIWNYGVSPIAEENEENIVGTSNGEISRVRTKCGFNNCKANAMPFTRFCALHILCDVNQTLYKGCIYKSGQVGLCQKPILRATMPSLCPAHSQKVQKHLLQSLKKNNVNLVSSGRSTTQFNTILVEHIRMIRERRKKALKKASKLSNSTVDTMIIDEKVKKMV